MAKPIPAKNQLTTSPKRRAVIVVNLREKRKHANFLSLWPLDVIDTLLKGKQHFIDQGALHLPTIAIWTIGSVIAGVTANERYHRFL
jgi:hypothetical protein